MAKNSRIIKVYISISVICLILGALLTMSIHANNSSETTANTEQQKNATLIELIDNLEQESADLETKVEEIRAYIATASEEHGTNPEMVARLQKELEILKFLADQTEVTGEGIAITLDDNVAGAEAAKGTLSKEDYFPENYIVHDSDLRYLLNGVAYLAEAISINNQRLVNTSDIRCVGTVIMVNSTRLAPPYEIKLIGPSNLLEAALLASDQYIYLKNKDMPLKISKSENLVLPAYTSTISTTVLKSAETHIPKTENLQTTADHKNTGTASDQ
jgi:uncharacterized protein YlxW (UPF0749 family)